jgi:hypothetical protein
MNQEERNQKIEEYGRGYEELAAALAEVPREVWDFKPAAEEWNLHEVLNHFADSEINGLVRLYKLISEPGDTIMMYEESIWAKAMDYQHQDSEEALQIFKLLRHRTYNLLKRLPHSVYDQSLVHPMEEYNPYTLDLWLNIYVDHVPEHVEQIQNNYKAWKEQKK